MIEFLGRHWYWFLLAVGVIAPLLAPNDYVVGVLARICLYSMLALGLNIVVGFAGLLDIGYVAFFGIGSYVYAFLASPHFGLHLPGSCIATSSPRTCSSVMEPLLGPDIKQVAQQIHWKPPGATNRTGYRFHQDLRFRERKDAFRDLMSSYINTGLAIDPATRENGCLQVFPDSHQQGYLGLSDDGPIMKGTTQTDELVRAGLDPARVVDLELEPGDLALWGLLTVHGSNANHSPHDRAFEIQSYVRAASSDRGEWAFRGGESIALGAEPVLCKYEQLREKPGPFYSDNTWYE